MNLVAQTSGSAGSRNLPVPCLQRFRGSRRDSFRRNLTPALSPNAWTGRSSRRAAGSGVQCAKCSGSSRGKHRAHRKVPSFPDHAHGPRLDTRAYPATPPFHGRAMGVLPDSGFRDWLPSSQSRARLKGGQELPCCSGAWRKSAWASASFSRANTRGSNTRRKSSRRSPNQSC